MCRVLINDAKPRITQKYKLTHKAIDLVKSPSNTCKIVAHSDGTIIWLQKYNKNNKLAVGNKSYGNCVKIKHKNGYFTLYAHLKDIYIKKGQKVVKGQEIGYMGNTGRSFGAHLHWEVRNTKDNRINPTPYLDKDLPIYYQVYDNKKNKWLPKITIDSNDYAGNLGNSISGLKIDLLSYKAHDKVKNKWLPIINGSNGFAGNLPNDIDGVAIKSTEYKYQVHIKGGNWLPYVDGYNTKDSINGYAGNLGQSIDGLRIIHK